MHSVAVFCEWRRVIFVRMFEGAFNEENVALVYENVTCAFVLSIMREIQRDGPSESNTFFVLKRIVLKQCFLRIVTITSHTIHLIPTRSVYFDPKPQQWYSIHIGNRGPSATHTSTETQPDYASIFTWRVTISHVTSETRHSKSTFQQLRRDTNEHLHTHTYRYTKI